MEVGILVNELALKFKSYTSECVQSNDSKRHCYLSVSTPSDVHWTGSVVSSLNERFGQHHVNTFQYSPRQLLYKVGKSLPYKRSVVKYKFSCELGCVCTVISKERQASHDMPADSVEGKCMMWKLPDIHGVVIMFLPEGKMKQQAGEARQKNISKSFAWNLGDTPDFMQ